MMTENGDGLKAQHARGALECVSWSQQLRLRRAVDLFVERGKPSPKITEILLGFGSKNE